MITMLEREFALLMRTRRPVEELRREVTRIESAKLDGHDGLTRVRARAREKTRNKGTMEGDLCDHLPEI